MTFEEKVDERYSSKILTLDDGGQENLVVSAGVNTNSLPATIFKDNMGRLKQECEFDEGNVRIFDCQ